ARERPVSARGLLGSERCALVCLDVRPQTRARQRRGHRVQVRVHAPCVDDERRRRQVGHLHALPHSLSREDGTMAPTPAEARTPTDRDWHTDDLPATPQRDFLIPAPRWIEAPEEVRALGADLGIELVAYKRRIGRYLLWRAGPASGADARYMAIASDDL